MIVLGGLAGAAGLTLFESGQLRQPAAAYAAAIERGVQDGQRPTLDPEAVEDEALTHDAWQAGYRWAERQSLDDPAKCPTTPSSFYAGCSAWVSEQR